MVGKLMGSQVVGHRVAAGHGTTPHPTANPRGTTLNLPTRTGSFRHRSSRLGRSSRELIGINQPLGTASCYQQHPPWQDQGQIARQSQLHLGHVDVHQDVARILGLRTGAQVMLQLELWVAWTWFWGHDGSRFFLCNPSIRRLETQWDKILPSQRRHPTRPVRTPLLQMSQEGYWEILHREQSWFPWHL